MTLIIKQFHHIWLEVLPGQESHAREFYQDILGAKEIERPYPFDGAGLWMSLCGVQLHFGTETNGALRNLQQLGKNGSDRHFALVVDNAQVAREELQEKNISIKEGTPITGMDRFSFRDPWNNKIEIFSQKKEKNEQQIQ